MKDSVQLYLRAPHPTHTGTRGISILFLSLFRRQFRLHGARCDFASVLGYEAGGMVDIDETGTEDVTPPLVAVGLLGDGGEGLKA
jgi:hypothetical protein